MKNRSLLFKEFVNEGFLQKMADSQMRKIIKHYAKLSHLADLLAKDLEPLAKVEKHKIAKKIIFTSLKHVNFFRQIHSTLAKITKYYLDLKEKTAIDSNDFLIEVKKLKDQRTKSYDKYVKDIASYRENVYGKKGDELVKDVLELYNKIKH